jgi:hypothetical protein
MSTLIMAVTAASMAENFIHFVCFIIVRLFHTCKAKMNCGLSTGYFDCHAAKSLSLLFLTSSKSKVANSDCSFSSASFFSFLCSSRSALLEATVIAAILFCSLICCSSFALYLYDAFVFIIMFYVDMMIMSLGDCFHEVYMDCLRNIIVIISFPAVEFNSQDLFLRVVTYRMEVC